MIFWRESRSALLVLCVTVAACGGPNEIDSAEPASAGQEARNVDPCQVISAADVKRELGIAVAGRADLATSRQQGSAAQIKQGRCDFRAINGGAYALGVNMTSFDDPAKVLEQRSKQYQPAGADHQQRKFTVDGIGRGIALADIPPQGGPASIEVAVERWVLSITLNAPVQGSKLATLKRLAQLAVERIDSGGARYVDPGLEALAGAWFATTADGRLPKLELIVEVDKDGGFASTVGRESAGLLQMSAGRWQVRELGTDQPLGSGDYAMTRDGKLSVRGQMANGGPGMKAELARVPCGKPPGRLYPYEGLLKYSLLKVDLPGAVRVKLKKEGKTGAVDVAAAGLWEGEAVVEGIPVTLIWRIRADSQPQSVMTFLGTERGRMHAENGVLTITRSGQKPQQGRYDLLGQGKSGAIRVWDTEREWNWVPYDPAARNPRIDHAIVNECTNNNQ
jgi:hypothetical protein